MGDLPYWLHVYAGGWLNVGLGWEATNVDLFYNIADAINKIGFGLVVYSIAISDSKPSTATA